MAIALDTLEYARRLRQAGFSEQQAEGQAQALAAVMTDSLATRTDLRALEAHVDHRFETIDARFETIDARFEAIDARFDALDKQLEIRFGEQEKRLEVRLSELEKRLEIRFREQDSRFGGRLTDLERRMTLRLGGIMVAAAGTMSALARLL